MDTPNTPPSPDAAANTSADTGAGQQTGSVNPAPAWHDSIADEGLKAFITTKGYKDAADAVKALQELEGKAAVPESADAYQLPVPEGADAAFAQEASRWMHEAGIPVAAAQALADKWNGYMAAQAQAAQTQRAAQGEADIATLKTEWGNQYDANIELGRRAVRTFGIDEATLDGISGALGDAATLKLFQSIGAKLGEATLVPAGGGGQAAGKTPSLEDLMFPTMKTQAAKSESPVSG